jgi:lipoprotein-anchoring transpeptidase ErfK/SrfK
MSDYGIEHKTIDISTPAPRSWRWLKWLAVGLAVLVMLAALGAAGVAYATYDYSERFEGRILPGTVVAGVDISGMKPRAALQAVRAEISPELTRQVKVRYRDRTWSLTPRKLGARSNAAEVVNAAVGASANQTFMDKVRMRVLGEELAFERPVSFTYPRAGVRGFIEALSSRLNLEPRDASLDYSSGWVEIRQDRAGREVNSAKGRARLMRALRQGAPKVTLPVRVIEPEVTAEAYDQVLLVRIGENRLYLYQDGEITHSWSVATGQPEYMTPTGVYEITEKRYLPTWINPAPTTWGADLPREIPPGPDNPLGVRALNWSAPAIRFHGTEATYSLGYNASHGCVRLSNAEVVQLYDLVDVGTPIVSLVAGALKPLYVSSPDPTLVAGDGGSGNGGSQGGGSEAGGSGNGGSQGRNEGNR